ncbi:MAG: M23 family metallopeptidase [Fidelibacterota bacterium]
MNRIIICTIGFLAVLTAQDYLWPTDAGKSLTSNFGEFRDHHFHMGLDIKTLGKIGASVYAVEKGYISRMVSNYKGYGKALYVIHPDGNTSVYAHLSHFNPKLEGLLKYYQNKNESYILNHYFQPNEFNVAKGELIGYSGETGHSFGPHLHFEIRNSLEQPLNPQTNGFVIDDRSSPTIDELAVIPLEEESRVNGSLLPVRIPFYRNRNGVFELADTLNIFGPVGFALKAIDKRQGFSEKYQIKSIDLIIDGILEYSLNYDYLDYSTSDRVQLVRNHQLYRLNLGSFHNLYHMDNEIRADVQPNQSDGCIKLSPGYHSFLVKVIDANSNSTTGTGVIFNRPPIEIILQEVIHQGNDIIFTVLPKLINIPLKSITCYSFSSSGLADKQIKPKLSIMKNGGLVVTIDRRMIRDRSLQFIAKNKMGAYAIPLNWHPKKVWTDYNAQPEIDINQAASGVIIQVETGNLGKERPKVHLQFENQLINIPMHQIQPFVFLSSPLKIESFADINSINTTLNIETEYIYKYDFSPSVAGSGKAATVLSEDKMCSLQSLKTTLYSPTLLWIEAVENSTPPPHGTFLSRVYQLQPFNIPLQDTVRIGIRYNDKVAEMDKISLYYYDQDDGWTFISSKNSLKRHVLTGGIRRLEAVCILQDIVPPQIQSTFPADGGQYYIEDVSMIEANFNDLLSGIEPAESAMTMIMDGKRLLVGYQPVKQIMSYELLEPLHVGDHILEVIVKDRAGNEAGKRVNFTIK